VVPFCESIVRFVKQQQPIVNAVISCLQNVASFVQYDHVYISYVVFRPFFLVELVATDAARKQELKGPSARGFGVAIHPGVL